jgi:hypothetical protein
MRDIYYGTDTAPHANYCGLTINITAAGGTAVALPLLLHGDLCRL